MAYFQSKPPKPAKAGPVTVKALKAGGQVKLKDSMESGMEAQDDRITRRRMMMSRALQSK